MSALRGSDTAKAAGLAGAMVANNVIALGSVIVFSRELSDYGSQQDEAETIDVFRAVAEGCH